MDWRRKYSLDDCKRLAKERGGRCLSSQYKHANTRLIWECSEGHKWEATFNQIKGTKNRKASWCRRCIAQGLRGYNIAQLKAHAADKGGDCLSEVYINNKVPLLWTCIHGHKWRANVDSIMRLSTWCPSCPGYYHQELTRQIFTKIFNHPFVEKFPDFLRTDRTTRRQIDGLSEELSIGFEYNGEQHYRERVGWRGLGEQQAIDNLKFEKCLEQGILLFIIPYVNSKWIIKKEDLKEYIIREVQSHRELLKGLLLNFDFVVDFDQPHRADKMEKLKILIESKGGKLLSDVYVDTLHKYRFTCEKDHQCLMSYKNIMKGNWCKKCGDHSSSQAKKTTIETYKKIAINNGGLCLTEDVKNSNDVLEFKCSFGHTFKAIGRNILKKSWCPQCPHKNTGKNVKYNIDDLRKFAKEMGGRCLSLIYLNTKTKYTWQCKFKHKVWEAKWEALLRGSWCPQCGIISSANAKRKNTIT